MKILHVVAALTPEGGGLTDYVTGICRAQAAMGADVRLATLAGERCEIDGRGRLAAVKLTAFKPSLQGRFLLSYDMRRGLPDLVRAASIVHLHSLWTYPVWCAGHAALKAGKPLLISPHGCLLPERLKRSRSRKRLAGMLFQRRHLRRATCLHATATAEAESLRAYGLRQPIAILPCGVDVEAFQGASEPESFRRRCGLPAGQRLLLSLSRLEAVKGLDLLITAWAGVAARFPDWHLVIAGPDERGTEARLREQVGRCGLAARVTCCGPLFGDARRDAVAAADLFVLPSRSENFAITVAEAAYMGKPVLTTQGTPWSGLVARRAGWWVPISVEALAGALSEALSLDAGTLVAMGARGRQWVEEAFTWPHICRQWLDVYTWVCGQAPRPACVPAIEAGSTPA